MGWIECFQWFSVIYVICHLHPFGYVCIYFSVSFILWSHILSCNLFDLLIGYTLFYTFLIIFGNVDVEFLNIPVIICGMFNCTIYGMFRSYILECSICNLRKVSITTSGMSNLQFVECFILQLMECFICIFGMFHQLGMLHLYLLF